MSGPAILLETVALHELCHAFAAKALRLRIVKAHITNGGSFIRVEYNLNFSGRLKVLLVQLSPFMFELPLGLWYFKGVFRLAWLRVWLHTRRHFAKFFLYELRD